ncbi:MAG TPA: ABC transporter ATP-binding protein [Archaeoglobus profundus]|nr:ABC transporter ATP-binding protein [Archaeoglobus profundus]
MMFLQIKNVTLKFGGVTALDNVSFDMKRGEILALIGPNGAGKTSLLNCISGFYKPQSGKIFFKGIDITNKKPYEIARLGIARTFQNIELYSGMTTLEIIMSGRHIYYKCNPILVGLGLCIREEVKHRKRVEEIMDFLDLQKYRRKTVETLPHGIKKRIELGRALALEPELLLLDEPMGGLSFEEKEDMAVYILEINENLNISILLIEHDMGFVMDIADRIVVLDRGRVIACGKPDEIAEDPRVIQAYVGE